jgi:CDP-diacylglycerol--glycerol-3-phosphate 3-phosphatidyltransferase
MTFGMGIANFLTLIRIGLIPICVVVFYLPVSSAHYIAGLIFALACVTDWLDGFLARKLKELSLFGAFFDPVADKLLVSSCLLMLVGSEELHYITLPAIVIVGREIVISALREWMAEIGKRASIAVNYVAKVKTTLQMVAIFLLIACKNSTDSAGIIGIILIYVAAILTIWSMVVYLQIAWPELTKKTEHTG